MDKVTAFRDAVKACRECSLSGTCNEPVPGAGWEKSKIMIVGEAPGKEEDRRGFPFVGESGRLLRNTLLKLYVTPESLYITNVVKCRPPENRNPTTEEVGICKTHWLDAEIGELVRPSVVLMLGRVAQHALLPYVTELPHGRSLLIRNVFYVYFHHPSYWLRNGGCTYADLEVVPILTGYVDEWRSKKWL